MRNLGEVSFSLVDEDCTSQSFDKAQLNIEHLSQTESFTYVGMCQSEAAKLN